MNPHYTQAQGQTPSSINGLLPRDNFPVETHERMETASRVLEKWELLAMDAAANEESIPATRIRLQKDLRGATVRPFYTNVNRVSYKDFKEKKDAADAKRAKQLDMERKRKEAEARQIDAHFTRNVGMPAVEEPETNGSTDGEGGRREGEKKQKGSGKTAKGKGRAGAGSGSRGRRKK